MKQWNIEGGNPLHGEIAVAGAKNVVVKLMIAALLAEEETTLTNVPDVGDVENTAEMIKYLGGTVERIDDNAIRIFPQTLTGRSLPQNLAQKSRVSTMFAGPLLIRQKEANLPLPGGDRIGRRPLNWHFDGLRKLNAEVKETDEGITLQTAGLRGNRYRFPRNTHTGTETLILAAALADGQTVLENAALEPEVDDLISMLNQMGARIQRTAPRTITIDGVQRLKGTTYRVMPDRNEQVSLCCMALATGGDVWIRQAQPKHLDAFLHYLEEMGAGLSVNAETIHVWYRGPLRPLQVTTAPHPGLMTDWQPLLTTLLTQAQGTSLVHETVFDRRFDFVDELRQMGASVELYNPVVECPREVYNFNWDQNVPDNFHAARIYGPSKLHGIRVNVTDVRAGASLVQAALMANGRTTVSGVEHIERGYERLVPRLRSLGAIIEETSIPESQI